MSKKQTFVPAWDGTPVVPAERAVVEATTPVEAPKAVAAPEPTSDSKPMDMDFAMKAMLLMLCAKNKREHEAEEAAAEEAKRRGR